MRSDKRSENSDFSSEASRIEMRRDLRVIAGLSLEENRKAAFSFVAGVLNIPYGRVRRLFYGEARRIEAHEVERVRAFVGQAVDLISARAAYEAELRRFRASGHPAVVKISPPSLEELEDSTKAPVKPRRRQA